MENGTSYLLLQFGIILFWALTLGTLFERVGLPSILGYTLAGITLGEVGVGEESLLVKVLADLGMVLLLFYIGLEFSVKRLLKTGSHALFLSPVKSGLGFLLGFLSAKLLGLPDLAAVVAGATVAVSSTGIISNTILEKRLEHTVEAQLALSMLILEDILSVLFIGFLTSGGKELGEILFNSFVVLLLILTVGIYLSRWFFRLIRAFGHEDAVALYALGLLVLFSYGVSLFGLSPALGAFFAGVALSEVAAVPRIKKDLEIMKKLLVMLFFTFIGLSFTPTISTNSLILASLLVLAQLAAVSTAALLSPFVGVPPRSAARFLALDLPIGEFSLFFAATAAKTGIPGSDIILGAVFVAVFITTILSKVLLDRWERVAQFFVRALPMKIGRRLAVHTTEVVHKKRIEKSVTSILANLSALFAIAYVADYAVKHLEADLRMVAVGILVLAVYPIYRIVLELMGIFRHHMEQFLSLVNPHMDALERKVISKKAGAVAMGFLLFIVAILTNVVAQTLGTVGLKMMALLLGIVGILSLLYGILNVLSFLVVR